MVMSFIRYLLQSGADVDIRDNEEHTIKDAALKFKNRVVADFLDKYVGVLPFSFYWQSEMLGLMPHCLTYVCACARERVRVRVRVRGLCACACARVRTAIPVDLLCAITSGPRDRVLFPSTKPFSQNQFEKNAAKCDRIAAKAPGMADKKWSI
jgi:hypothetical protein